VIIGAGICGAAAAHFLTEQGAEVLVVDRAGVSEGTTGLGEGNVLVCDRPPGYERELAKLGRDLWLQLDASFPQARVTRKGALMLDQPAGEALAAELEPELSFGVACTLEPDELQVDPGGLVHALLEPISVRTDTEVAGIEAGAVVLTSGERLRCREVIVATGPWARDLTGLPVEPRKGQLAALAAPRGLIRHKLIEASYRDVVASASAGLQVATVIEQTLDGDEVLVGSSRERAWFDPRVDRSLTRTMVDRAARFVPVLRELAVRREWCGFRSWLPDGLPAVGKLCDGIWVTTGQEGSGVGIGPLCGLLLARLITGREPGFDMAPLDPRRFR
jgi:D-hydroxyproline dehydrogenase subunit beta